jgi:hypothetical protein
MSAVTGEFEEIAPATCVSAILSNLTTPNTSLQPISRDPLMSRFELENTWKVSITSYCCAFSEYCKCVPTEKLYNSPYGSPEKIDLITVCFDKLTKSAFKDAMASAFIVFGSERDNDPSVNIELGQLKLPGSVNRC